MRKFDYRLCENKGADQLCSNCTADLISAFVFATWIVQFLFFLNQKFQAFSFFSGTAQPGLCRTWSEAPNTDFLASRLILTGYILNRTYSSSSPQVPHKPAFSVSLPMAKSSTVIVSLGISSDINQTLKNNIKRLVFKKKEYRNYRGSFCL